MALSDKDILKLMKTGKLKVVPFKKEQLGPASIDLTLSDEWHFFREEYIGKTVDLSKKGFKELTKKIKSKSIILNPGEMCLGKTLEKITLAPDVMGILEGRSRYARVGLTVHITASVIQPGSNNHQILEIVNLSPLRIVLHAGMQISQMSFHKLENPTTQPYYKFGKIARRQ
ncbi:MAG: dCTP deaminase [Candidatus ainarchaeum sp.]|nr:dCTP deaminase [Candidatus ainarchaeum sp.]